VGAGRLEQRSVVEMAIGTSSETTRPPKLRVAGLRAADEPMPRGLRVALWSGLALLVAGAAYLLAVRGTALMLDLSQFAGNVLCF
jgi:hypothetical protein